MSLSDEDSSVVDTLRQTQLEHLSLQPSLQEVLHPQAQHVVELHARLVQHSYAHQPPQQSVSLEETARVLLLERQQLSGGRSDLGEGVLDSPHLPLVPQAVLADELQLLVQASLLEGTPRRLVRFAAHNSRHGSTAVLPCARKEVT